MSSNNRNSNKQKRNGNKKYNKGGNNKYHNKSRIRDYDDKTHDPDRVGSNSANDPNWYKISDSVAKQFASLPFSTMVGTTYEPISPDDNDLMPGGRTRSMPGIMIIECAPSVGVSIESTSPINVAARKNFALTREANAGSVNYEGSDMMMYILAMTSIYSIWFELSRVYGMMRHYNPLNRYTPAYTVQSLGTNYKTMAGEMNNFVGRLNLIATRINQMYVPANMDYIRRQLSLYDTVYTDDQTGKAQYYAFKSIGYWVYDEINSKLDFTSWPSYVMDPFDRLDALEAALQKILESSTLGIMSGDILKAFGADKCVKLPEIPTTHRVEPVYDKAILMQIENMTIQPIADRSTLSVTQATVTEIGSYLVHRPKISSVLLPTNISTVGGTSINIHSDNPTADEVIESVQLKVGVTDGTDNAYVDTCSVVIPMNMQVWYLDNRFPTSIQFRQFYSSLKLYDTLISDGLLALIKDVDLLTAFSVIPFFGMIATGENGVRFDISYIQDVDNAVVVPLQQLQKIHDMCLQGVFHIR